MTSQQKKWLLAVCLLTAAGIGGTCLYLNTTKAPMTNLEELNAPGNSIYYTMPEEEHIAADRDLDVEYIDNELLVTVEDEITEEQLTEFLEERDGKIVGHIEDLSLYQVRFKDTYTYQELEQMGRNLESSDMIQKCRENLVSTITEDYIPGDSRWKSSWGKETGETWALEAIHMDGAWDQMEAMDSSVSVGIFDTGFYELHEDLEFASPPLANQTEDPEGSLDSHGTCVAGIIGAGLDNDTGISGILTENVRKLYGVSAWGLSLEDGKMDVMAFQTGLAYLISVKQCRVVNLSISPYDRQEELDSILFQEYQEILEECLAGFLDAGHDFLIVRSAGNDSGRDAAEDPLCAISQERVKSRILVVEAACRQEDGSLSLASASSTGERTDLSAPGGSQEFPVTSTSVRKAFPGLSKSGYSDVSGTSMAAAYVSGTAALIYSINPYLDGEQVCQILRDTAGDIPMGAQAPFLDAQAAVEQAVSTRGGGQRTVAWPADWTEE